MSAVTSAIRVLREAGVTFAEHEYVYEDRGGTRVSSRELGVPEHQVVKTLVMEDERREPLLVLMHGDREVSTKALARQLGRKSIAPCSPEVAHRHTGYLVGGTSPFGTRKPLLVCVERSVLDLDRVFVNGGRRGLLVSLSPSDLERVLSPVLVDVATSGQSQGAPWRRLHPGAVPQHRLGRAAGERRGAVRRGARVRDVPSI